jgi:uncharacterized protein
MMPSNDAELTGNDYISITRIAADASLDGITVLHAGLAGLVEWAGAEDAPLFRLAVAAGGEPVSVHPARWRRLDRWIPSFAAEASGDVAVSGVVCAPAGYPAARGFFLRVELEAGGRAAVDASVTLELNWTATRRWIASGRLLPGANRLYPDSSGALVLETDDGRGPALAVLAGSASSLGGVPAGGASVANGNALQATITQALTLTPKRRTTVTFYIGAGREGDGAVAAARSLRRRGADELLRQARLELSYTLRAAQDHRWSDMLNRNLLFNRYYAVGRGIDDDQLWLVRSRTPSCPAPALFNEREALFWTLPALVAAEPALAREALLRCLDVYSERSGEYLRYLDGAAFDSGFVLEQFLMYAWAINHYVTVTEDTTLLDEPVVQQVVMENDAALYMRLHPEHLICSSELLPSGDAADHPWTSMGNALVRAFAAALPRIWPKFDGNGAMPARFDGVAQEVAATVWQFCTVDVGGEQILAWSSGLDGSAAVYDDPALSLALLSFFGFCGADDPIWNATMEFLRSSRYPLWRDGVVPGIAHRERSDEAALAALIADLAGPARQDALDRLLRVRLPAGFAAEAYDPASGHAVGAGSHHAALAGFLAWSLIRAAEPKAAVQRKPGRR